jgi:ABC-type multidrug transport system permease subunit
MGFAWRTALKDFQRHRRSPFEFAVWLGVPLLVGGLMVMVSGGRSGPRPQAHVLVVDQDDSNLSRLLLGALSQDAAGNFFIAERVQLDAGRERVAKGEATALLVIPKGFSDAVLREDPCTLQLVTNPAQRILPGMVEEALSIVVDASFYVHRLVGDDLRAFAGGPGPGSTTFPDAQIADFSVRVNQLVRSLDAYIDPLVMRLEASSEEVEKKPQPNFALLFVPGILFMSLLFMAQGLSEDLWTERDQKTLRRVVVSPRPVTAFLAGKTLYAVLLMATVALVALGIGFAYFDLPIGRLPLAVVWAAFSGTVFFLGMMALQVHCASQRAASITGMILIFPLMMIGGNFFPFEAMPDWMVAVGKRTPNGWALQQLKGILSATGQPLALVTAFAALAGAGILFFFAGARKLRRGFAQG